MESQGFGEAASLRNDAFKSSEKALLLRYSNIEGSPYENTSFKTSDIHFTSGSIKNDVSVRLNLHESNLEFMKDSELFILTNINHVKKITFPDKEIVFINREGNLKGFYEIKLSGRNMLVSSLKVDFKEAVNASNSYIDNIEAAFIKEKEKRYILMESGELLIFKNKKEFNDKYDDAYSDMVSFVKLNKLNPTKYNDLVQILNFINSNASDVL